MSLHKLKTDWLTKAPQILNDDARHLFLNATAMLEHMVMYENIGPARTLAALLWYGNKHHSRRNLKPMDVETLVTRWKEVIIDLCLSHDKEGRDRADFQTDELLGPILTAPVAQLREFAKKLTGSLKEDQRVPWLVWSVFEKWTEEIVMKGEDKGIIELKKELAKEVAELAEKGLSSSDWVEAIAGALRWRSPTQLEEVKEGLKKGAKPRLKGRESCLFLSVDTEQGERMVQL